MSKFEELVEAFREMEENEKVYWLMRIVKDLKVCEVHSLGRQLERLLAEPSSGGSGDSHGVREPKGPKVPLISGGATRERE